MENNSETNQRNFNQTRSTFPNSPPPPERNQQDEEVEEILSLGKTFHRALKEGSVEKRRKIKALMIASLDEIETEDFRPDSETPAVNNGEGGISVLQQPVEQHPILNIESGNNINGRTELNHNSDSISDPISDTPPTPISNTNLSTRKEARVEHEALSNPAPPTSLESVTVGNTSLSWAEKLGRRGVGKTFLSFVQPTMVEGKPVVHVSSSHFTQLHSSNSNLVIGSFVGKRPEFRFVKSIIETIWKPKHKYTMNQYGKQSYSFDFSDDEDRENALEAGCFHIASQLFVVQMWKPFVEADINCLKSIPIWVLFKEYPMELWDTEGFSKVASAIGVPMFPDRLTEQKKRTAYARICIEVKEDNQFLTSVPIVLDNKTTINVQVEYNWKPSKCNRCRVFGHHDNTCPKLIQQQQGENRSVWVQRNNDSHMSEGNSGTVADQRATKKSSQGQTRQLGLGGSSNNNSYRHAPTTTPIPSPALSPASTLPQHTPPTNASSSAQLLQPSPLGSPSLQQPTPAPQPQHHFTLSHPSVTIPAPRTSYASIAAPTPAVGAWLTPKNPVKPRNLVPNDDQQNSSLAGRGDATTTPRNAAAEKRVDGTQNVVHHTRAPPFKGLVPGNQPRGINVNPFEVKDGENLSFEEELERHKKAREWEAARKKNMSPKRIMKPTQENQKDKEASPRRSTRMVASPPKS